MNNNPNVFDPNDPFRVPYHHTTRRGRKRTFLDEIFPLPPVAVEETDSPVSRNMITRRGAIKASLVATATIAGLTIQPRRAEAGFIGFVAGAIFSAGIGWLMGRVLDQIWPQEPNDYGLTETPKPTPSKSGFHNDFAERYMITNRDLWIQPRRNNLYGCQVGLEEYLLLIDVNGLELTQIKREFEYYDSAMIPFDYRRPFNATYHRATFEEVKKAYDFDATPADINYVQTFRDNEKREHLGFAVTRGEKSHLLLS